jgi:uncharacterized cupredoxin-like copper-binding protein
VQVTRAFFAVAVLFACLLAVSAAHAEFTYDPPVIKKTRPPEYAFGREGDPRKVKRVIKIEMSDTMRYFPDEIRVKRGDTVRFVLRNGGKSPHEMVIGSMEELKKRATLVRHGDAKVSGPGAAHVAAGSTARFVWQFTRPGEYYYACLIPGHFDAGMIGTIVVR